MAIKKRIVRTPKPVEHVPTAYPKGTPAGGPRPLTVDCTGMDIGELLRKVFYDKDADEVILRVCQYGNKELEPAMFQAIVKFSKRNMVWSVIVDENEVQALLGALFVASRMEHNEDGSLKNDGKDTAGSLRLSADAGVKRTPGVARKKIRAKIRKP